jgi:protocatechuate 3,4-dioxygenase beta subunit
MSVLARHSLLLGLALLASLVLLGRWMLAHDDAGQPSPSAESATNAPAQVQPVAEEPLPEAPASGRATTSAKAPRQRTAALHGRVYDEDTTAPIADARIEIYRVGADTREHKSVSTAADGTFVLEGVVSGHVQLGVSAPDYAHWSTELKLGDNTAPLEIGLFVGGAITGRLVAADGRTPVLGKASLFDLDRGWGGEASTDPAAEFEFRDLQPGRYQLSAYAASGRVSRDIVLAKNQRLEGIILALAAGHSIRGVVTGLSRDELARVTISYGTEGDVAGPTAEGVRVDERGAFVLPGVAPGRAYVRADVQERRGMWKAVEMPADSDLTVDFHFPRGARLSGRITRGEEPLSGVSVWPQPLPGVHRPAYVHGTTTSEDGTYVIDNVPPDTYALVIEGHRTSLLEVSADMVFDFDLPTGQILGQVLEPGGEPIAGATVYLWPADSPDEQRPRPGRSDHLGKFAVGGLAAGEFMLTVYKPGYEMLRKRISYDAQAPELTLHLREDLGVELTARDVSTGRPIRQLAAAEVIGAGRGTRLGLELDEDGKGYLPKGLAGSTLRFLANGYEIAVVDSWDGERLELQFVRTGAQ